MRQLLPVDPFLCVGGTHCPREFPLTGHCLLAASVDPVVSEAGCQVIEKWFSHGKAGLGPELSRRLETRLAGSVKQNGFICIGHVTRITTGALLLIVNLGFFLCYTYCQKPNNFLFYAMRHMSLAFARLFVVK